MWLSRDDFYLHYRREIRKKGVEFSNPKELGFCPNRLQNAESLIGDEIKKGQFAGAVSLVSRRGKVALFNSHGYADLANEVPMREDTLFQIGRAHV